MFDGISIFIGTLLDALIGPNFVIPGEPFYLAAGYQLHQGLWVGVIAALLGGFVGDQLSYCLGFKCGNKVQKRLLKRSPKSRRLLARCRYLMMRKGVVLVLFARLLGPVAWVVPFLAGVQRYSWVKFSGFSFIGLLIGGGQFIVWGYLLSVGLEQFAMLAELKTIFVEHQYSLLTLSLVILFGVIGHRCGWRMLAGKCLALFIVCMLFANYSHFFWRADDIVDAERTNAVAITPINKEELSYKAFPGHSPFFDAQAVNVMFLGNTPSKLMETLGWIENHTFSRHDLEWGDYIGLLRSNTPPVSDLFWQGRPQDTAYQLPGSLIKRSHIRWWQAGVDTKTKLPIWLGAISYDDGLTMTPYSGIVTVLHSVDPNVDIEREKFKQQISTQANGWAVAYLSLTPEVILDDNHDYYSDGRVLIIQPSLLTDSDSTGATASTVKIKSTPTPTPTPTSTTKTSMAILTASI